MNTFEHVLIYTVCYPTTCRYVSFGCVPGRLLFICKLFLLSLLLSSSTRKSFYPQRSSGRADLDVDINTIAGVAGGPKVGRVEMSKSQLAVK